MSNLRISLLAILAGAILGAVALMYFVPTLRVAAYPERMGFRTIAPGVMVEAAFSEAETAQLLRDIDTARARIARFYGAFDANVKLVACKTLACNQRLGGEGQGAGTAAAMTYGTPFVSVLRLAPRGLNPTIIAHEFSHAEFNQRAGYWALFRRKVPAWFNEGLAVVASDDARYMLDGVGHTRCLAPPTGLIEGLTAFRRAGGTDPALYARAACGVLIWMEVHGGRDAVLAALADLRGGAVGREVFDLPDMARLAPR
ncbi:hypothetical protein [Pseudothioclava nitratireducens]|uniref:hypothetical protein n=1 Tax=Pseudothioclava nitratireducens TaxID=1928646 RepID=UPI0023D98B98|nr:hypothetical protein [Defluviimonas nitratireducens]MDF1621334.1 hypothetical protein [Defluviimonas nitratireducens]